MCTRNVKINDEVMNLVKPHFKGDEALQSWMEKQLERVMWEYASQFQVKESDDHLLEKLNALDDSAEGFLKLDEVLPPAKSSVDELREDAYLEKYGI